MRSTFNGLNTMVRGIFANQMSLDTVGHNIVNAGSEGYSRQSVNLVATRGQADGGIYGEYLIGTGVDAISVTRARDIYADKQYRTENATMEYYYVMQKNFQKIETFFDDSDDNGIQNAMDEFHDAWLELSANASDNACRQNVISKGGILCDKIHTVTSELQAEIQSQYDEIEIKLTKINEITDKIVQLNKSINAYEAGGAMANDLRDQRDVLVDDLASYIDLYCFENSEGSYTVVSNNLTLVNGVSKLTLGRDKGHASSEYGADYGCIDYNIIVNESNIVYQVSSGSIKGNLDAIAENKYFINQLATLSAFMLTTFNAQHRAGFDRNGDAGDNFFGSSGADYENYGYSEFKYSGETNSEYAIVTDGTTQLTGIKIIEALKVSSKLTNGGTDYIAARSQYDLALSKINTDKEDTAQGYNAVFLSDFFNMTRKYTELTSAEGDNLFYSYTDLNGNTVGFLDEDFRREDANGNNIEADDTTTTVAKTYEVVYKGSDGIVYKVTDKENGDAVTYEDGAGRVLTTEVDNGVVTSYTDSDTNLTYDVAAKGFLIYESSQGKIYKNVDGNDEINYTAYYYVDGDDNVHTETVTASTNSGTFYDVEDSDMKQFTFLPNKDENGENKKYKVLTFTGNNIAFTAVKGEPIRAIGDVSLNAFYNSTMSELGVRSESINLKVETQEDVITQTQNWRSSTMSVDWNEELTNMIKFQKGFGACARCLSAMDEMLDRLVNNTGMVGR